MLSAPPGALVKGTSVTIHGLQSRSDLNGCDGVLATALDEGGRYGVYVGEKGTSVRIKPANILPRQAAQGLELSANAVETLQRANVPQLAWVLTEFGQSSSEFAEVALLYACVLFSPDIGAVLLEQLGLARWGTAALVCVAWRDLVGATAEAWAAVSFAHEHAGGKYGKINRPAAAIALPDSRYCIADTDHDRLLLLSAEKPFHIMRTIGSSPSTG